MSLDPAREPAAVYSAVPVLAGLIEEWPQVATATTARTLKRWARKHPQFAGVSSLDDIIRLLAPPPSPEHTQIVVALIELAQSGYHEAGRTLLQAFIPFLSKNSRGCPERGQELVSSFWDVMLNYPLDRRTPEAVISSLALDTLKMANKRMNQSHDTPAPDPEADPHEDSYPSLDDPFGSDAGLDEVLDHALRSGICTTEEVGLLRMTCVEHGNRYAAAARHYGLSEANARQRVSRIIRRLREAVQAQHAHRDQGGGTIRYRSVSPG